jgi:catechol 2,3-dioxygenase-like lactoylglutathione lyase family enzyme
MAIAGIERVVYGVEDMAEGRRFFSEWGLTASEDSPGRTLFRAADGGQIEIVAAADPTLPPAIEPGSTVRQVVWGVDTTADIDALEARIRAQAPACKPNRVSADRLELTDPMGLAIAFTLTGRTPTPLCAGQVAHPAPRIDQEGKRYERAEPQRIGHIVFTTPDIDAVEAFYTRVLGFRPSDRYIGRAVFLRCRVEGEHHNLFLLKSPDNGSHMHHIAFGVRDIHEVFGGGMAVAKGGWSTFMGPGRHVISSCYFWYFRNPCGGAAEYYADTDWVTEQWVPRELPQEARYFSEWMLTDGVKRWEGVQQQTTEAKVR